MQLFLTRYSKSELPDMQIELFAFLKEQNNESLAHTFTVITPNKTRITRL